MSGWFPPGVNPHSNEQRLIECAYCFRDFDSDNAVDSDDELVSFCSEDCMSEYKRERAEANVDSERDRD